jgi:hypothetical protein
VYPRVLMQKQSYKSPGPQSYSEYGEGNTALVATQLTTATPTYTPMADLLIAAAQWRPPKTFR